MKGDFRENRIGRRMPRGLYMLRATANDYAPVYLQTIGGINYYRLVISRRSGEDRDHNLIYLGDRLCRWMHDSRLPETIRSKIAMVEVIDKDWQSRKQLACTTTAAYKPPSKEFYDVGWRVTEDMYTLIVPEQTIDSLKGEPIHKEYP